MLNVLSWIVGIIFAADIILHLTAIIKQWEQIRRVTKSLLMPLLAGIFTLCWYATSANALPWLVVTALLMGCAGDIFLIDAHHPIGFPLGLACFAQSGMCCISSRCFRY